MTKDFRWWTKEDPAAAVFATVKSIQRQQSDRMARVIESLCLYDDFDSTGISIGDYTIRRNSIQNLSYNLIRSAVDTLHADLIQSRPRPMFLTSGGDYLLRKRSELKGKFVNGVFSENSFDRIASQCAKDAIITGYSACFVREENGRVSFERCLPHEIWVDKRDGLYGKPRSIYLVRYVDRDVLKELYPDSAERINLASDNFDFQWKFEDTFESDTVCVVEAWHLKSGPDSEDGRHVVCVSNTCLAEESWEHKTFPFAFLNWKQRTMGFFGDGLPQECRALQSLINTTFRGIAEGIRLHTHTKIGLPPGVNRGQFTSKSGTFVDFTNSPPVPIVFPAVSGDTYNFLFKTIDFFFQSTGIPMAATRSEKPAGVTSGRAIRLTTDLQSKRFKNLASEYEEFYMTAAKEVVRLMERLSEENNNYEVVSPGSKYAEKIKWNDVKLDENSYVVQVFPVGILPSTPQGKLESVTDMVNSGFAEKLGIPAEKILKLLDFPDTEEAFGTTTSSLDLIEGILHHMLESGEYLAPEPFFNYRLCLQVAIQTYQKWLVSKVPEDRLSLLRQFISECESGLNPPEVPVPAQPAPVVPEIPQELPDLNTLGGVA